MLRASAAHPVRNAADYTTLAPLLKTKHILGRLKHVQPNRATPCVSASLQHLAAELVCAADTPVGKGLVSTQQIEFNAQLLQVSWDEVVAVFTPACHSQQHTIASASAAYSAMPKQLLKFVQGSRHQALRLAATVLWLRKHGSSFWGSYIASLPKEPEMTCLLNYMPHEQHELQWLAAEAELEHRQARHFHNTIFSSKTGSLKACKLADQLQDSLWALSVVYSRALTDQVPGTSSSMSMMVPKIDLANHSFDANAEWSSDFGNGTLTLTANQNIAKGQPICIDYGAELDNTDLMRVFGFVVPGNSSDRLNFLQQQFDDDAADSHDASVNVRGDQQSCGRLLAGPVLQSVGLDSVVEHFNRMSNWHNGHGFVFHHEDPLLSRKLSAVLSLPLDASNQSPEAAVDDQVSQSGTSLSSEQASQQRHLAEHLQQQCQAVLSSHATTVSEDQALLRSQGSLTPRHAQAIKSRLEHKLLVMALMELLKTYIKAIREDCEG